jgi:hypothetical protein
LGPSSPIFGRFLIVDPVNSTVKLSARLCFCKSEAFLVQAMKAYEYMRSTGIVPIILYPGASWRRVVSFTLRPLYPANNPRTHRIGDSVDPRAGLDSLGEEKQSLALAEIESNVATVRIFSITYGFMAISSELLELGRS